MVSLESAEWLSAPICSRYVCFQKLGSDLNDRSPEHRSRDLRLADAVQRIGRHLQVAGDSRGVSKGARFSHSAKGPSGPAKNPPHAGVGHSDDFDQFDGKAKFNHARKQHVSGSSKSTARRRIRGNIERESAALQIQSLRGAGCPSSRIGKVSLSMVAPVEGKSRTQP